MKNKYLSILLVTLVILMTLSTGIHAAEYSLGELIKKGLNNNLEIKQLENDIETTKRNIELYKSRSDWQADLSLNKVLVEEDSVGVERVNDKVNISLNNKLSDDNININPTVSYDFDGSEIIYGMNINMDIYPNLPSENIKGLISLNNQLNQQKKELNTLKAELVKEWLNKYLQLVRLEENINILKDRLELAENNYNELIEKAKINEAGQQELLQSEADLKDAEYNLKEVEQQYSQLKTSLMNSLQLEKNVEMDLNTDNKVLNDLKEKTNNLELDKLNKEKTIENIVKTSSQFITNINQKNYLKKELNWLKKEDSPQVSIEGSYDNQTDFSAILNINYNIFDSGINELKIENKKQEIENKEITLTNLYLETEKNLDKLIDKVELAQMDVEKNKILYNKAVDEVDITSRQYESGAIEKDVLTNKRLNKKTAQINLKRANDNLFINKLELLIMTEPTSVVQEVHN
ncbi:MAG: TolC family protein [Halanaerobiales bacterium]|nr:TolC family protein [Halanaerobiales bacterium]